MDKIYMKLDNFVCCCRVETGAIIIGGFGVVLGIFESLLSFIFLVMSIFASSLFKEACNSGTSNSTKLREVCEANALVMVVPFLLFTWCIFKVFSHFRMIKGVEETDPSKFVPFFVFYAIVLGIDTLAMLFYLYLLYVSGAAFVLVVLGAIMFFIDFYIYSVVATTREHLKNSTNLAVYYTPHV